MACSKQTDEEFNNFLYKVNEISNIIGKLASNDKNLQKIGDLEAEQYLKPETNLKNDEKKNELKIKSNRTLINKKALLEPENQQEKSQESFMAEMSRDAEERYKNRMIRTEKMETLKKQAMLAFRRKEFEKALSYYNKVINDLEPGTRKLVLQAIEQIKDSPLLYQNRALTYINLKFYEKAIMDCETSLKFNNNSLKTWLLLAKAHYLRDDQQEFWKAIKQVKEHNPERVDFITEFVQNLLESKCKAENENK